MFLQPAAVLQNHPRKEETRAKGREGGQEGPASHQMQTQGTTGGKHTALLGFAMSSSQICSHRPDDRSQHSSQHHAQRPASLAAPAGLPPAVGNDSASLLPAVPYNTASPWLGSPCSWTVHGTLPLCSWAFPHLEAWRAGVAVLTALPATGQAACMAGREGDKPAQGRSQDPACRQCDREGETAGEKGDGGVALHTHRASGIPPPPLLQAGTRNTIIPTKPLQRHIPTSLSSKAKV